ncbi:tegument protein UL25 [Harp seal herpesvirus]|uniref:Tegument protein UL25 n=1 Tax=phocid gammaherpesvirus 3 TaxID=2560643 RepID=A0A0R5ZB16_9GAMA|nr:tegument protein UL25 [Harp seal herpesvirus]AJG42945.1 tegument protein UL25 [Harp seal herpesvirus]
MSLKVKVWPPSIAFWAPNPTNTLTINRDLLLETRRNAFSHRRAVIEQKITRVQKGLLRAELDAVVQNHVKKTQGVIQQLHTLENTAQMLLYQPSTPLADATAPTTPKSSHTNTQQLLHDFVITVAPGDPSFNVESDFKIEFLSGLYNRQSQWLPAFGPWYSNMTDAAMQRRVFPKELKGNLNLQNSTSLKLMTAALETVSSATGDFFTDARHISDTNAAFCLLNGYFCMKTSSPIPSNYTELLSNLDVKMELLVNDLKQTTQGKDFAFIYSNPQQLETIAPLYKQSTYGPDFFSDHKIFSLFSSVGMFTSNKQSKPQGAPQSMDIVYLITNEVFEQDVPPFLTYQWNLRTGIIALEILVLVYLLLEVAQVSGNTVHRRIQLATLLGNQYKKPQDSQPFTTFKKRQIFSFICENYIIPTLTHKPQSAMSALFPGIVLLAIEACDAFTTSNSQNYLINLSGKKYNEVFDIINQKYTFKNTGALLQSQTALRLVVERGLNVLLSKTNPVTTTQDIINTQFGGGDDYDTLYFLILGCLPITVAII